MKIEQYVMAYQVEQDRLRALLPDGYESLRPVLRVNAELRDNVAYVELNTPAESGGVRGWLNVGFDEAAGFVREGKRIVFRSETLGLEIAFARVGLRGSCPAEKDNAGCFYGSRFVPVETITEAKEFCDCEFRFNCERGAFGVSQGKTLTATPEESRVSYPRLELSVANVAVIPCKQVLGCYAVDFVR